MMFWRIFRLELRVAFRHSAEIANPLWFFPGLSLPFFRSVSVRAATAGAYCAGYSLPRCFHPCWHSSDCYSVTICRTAVLNTIDVVAVTSLPAVVLAKVMAHWMVTGLPLLILAPGSNATGNGCRRNGK